MTHLGTKGSTSMLILPRSQGNEIMQVMKRRNGINHSLMVFTKGGFNKNS
jgi:hypothetical protein